MTFEGSSGSARLLTRLLVVLGLLLGLWTLLLGGAAMGADLPAPFAAMTAPSSLPAALGYLVLLTGSLAVAVIRPRDLPRGGGPNEHLWTVTGSVAAVAATLGFFAYARCDADLPVLWHMYWVLQLFLGFLVDPGVAATCPVFPSLAIQIARLLALVALFGGAAAAMTLVLRGRYSKGRLAWDPAARYFVGVDEQSFPLLASALTDVSRTGRVFVVSPDPTSDVVATARSLGAVHLDALGDETEILQRALRRPWFSDRQHAFGLSQFACLSADADINLARYRELVRLLAPDTQVANELRDDLAITIRIDEVHRGERWWREQAQAMSFGHAGFTVDMVGVFDSTARHIVNRIRTEAVGRPAVIIDGDGSTSLALLKHLAREASWAELLSGFTGQQEFSPTVVLTGEGADEVERDARFLWNLDALDIRADPGAVAWHVDRRGLGADCLFAVLGGADQDGYLVGERIAQRLLARRVWVVEAASSPIDFAPTANLRRSQPLGEAAFEVVQRQPLAIAESLQDRLSTWELAAWHVAQLYEPRNPQLRQRPTAQAIRDNLRPVLNVGSLASERGLAWGPAHRAWRGGLCCQEGMDGGGHDPDCLFDQICAQEHSDWRRQREGEGWTYGPEKLDAPVRRSPLIIEWAALPEPGPGGEFATRDGTYRTVENVLEVLRVLGLSPWWRSTRVGVVESAIRLDRPVRVETARGTQQGDVNDWLLRDAGDEWVVDHESFATHYEVGECSAREYSNVRRADTSFMTRPATTGEIVECRDSSMTALQGDWIALEAGQQWLIPGDTFQRSYRLANGVDRAERPA